MKLKPAPATHDPDLLASCIEGDRVAQERFYRRYAPPALRVVRKYAHSQQEAMELLNSGMLRVFQKLDSFQGTGSLEGWVKRVVFRVVADHFRSKRKPATFEIADWDQPTPGAITHELYAEDLCKIIDTLPANSREVFWLHAVEGYAHAEIASKLDITEGTSRWHLNKARTILKERLASSAYKSNRYAG
ncbi:MAG: sigma-70 family RNA polymerase sigma factor [Bacteroidota bacterium]